jgi:hypothetical protein
MPPSFDYKTMRCFPLLLLLACTIMPLRAEECLYPFMRDGKWGYIDRTGKWIVEPRFTEPCPVFYGELAPVALADGFQPYGENMWLLNSWGYMNREGKIIAWHDKESGP